MKSFNLLDALKNWFVNEGSRRIFFGLYLLCNLAMFSLGYWRYAPGGRFDVVSSLVGPGLQIAKGAAFAAKFNLALVFGPVCRTLISFSRVSWLGKIIPFDKNITFHRHIAYAVFLFGWIHGSAHYYNFLAVSSVTEHSTFWYAFESGPGWTGQLLSIGFFLIATSAAEPIRRKLYELFWYTHHLYIFTYGLVMIHAAFCFVKADNEPYCAHGGDVWIYCVGGATLYALERLLREIRGRKPTCITKIIKHEGQVLEIQMSKPSITQSLSGQYIWINCPMISVLQWHPFTLTSCPEEPFISVHIRVAGDWTADLAKACKVDFSNKSKIVEKNVEKSLPKLMVDGPCGAATEDWRLYSVLLCVGAGIGVTPFASVLKSIFFMHLNPGSKAKVTRKNIVEKVYFIWICRETQAFGWFTSLLDAIEQKVPKMVDIGMYFTGTLKPNEIAQISIASGAAKKDVITGLRSGTKYGRPEWDSIFSALKRNHPNTKIGVFFCGPKALSTTLHKTCNKHNDCGKSETKFYYHKENF